MKRKSKVLAATVALGLLVAGLLGSGVLAQPPPTPTPPYGGGYHMGGGDMPCPGADGAGSQATLSRVANLLGVTPDQLRQELTSGKTLAQVAQAKGVTEGALVTTILAPPKDMLAVMVRYGHLTQEPADQIYQRMVVTTRAAINTPGYGWGGMMGGSGGMMQGGFGPGGMMGGSGGMMQGGTGYGSGGMMRGWGRTF